MKCPNCNTDNKDGIKYCKKCGSDLKIIPNWKPGFKWHLKVLIVIYSFLVIVFFLLNYLLKPYMRQIPKDITPWIKEIPKKT